MMRILALGATGAIGTQLINSLVPKGHELFVTSRSAHANADGVSYLQGNARDFLFLRSILQQRWDVIVDFMVYDTVSFHERMDMLLNATRQYVYLSSARVFGQSDEPITERSPRLINVSKDTTYLATDEYALSKARQEDLLYGSGRNNWTIVRPYITFGENRFQLGTLEKEAWLFRAVKGRSIVFCKPLLDKLTTLTDGRQVADMIGALVGNPAALGEDFNLAGGQSMTWGEVLSLYLDGLEAHLMHRPNVVLQDLKSFCDAANSVPQVIYDRMYDRCFDPTKISAIVDMEKNKDCRTSLEECFRSRLSGGDFLMIDGRGEALRDRAAGERTSLSEFNTAKQKIRYLAYRDVPLGLIKKIKMRAS